MWNREDFARVVRPPIIGVVHLPPLPESPGWDGDWRGVTAHTVAAAAALAGGGVGAVILENFHDAPFYPRAVPPATIAAMTRLAVEVRTEQPDLPLGLNVLRNDAAAALAVAQATGAVFIRVNVHLGATVTDQGLLEGKAHETLRCRRQLGAEVAILADLRVKHGRPLVDRPVVEEASELRGRGLADGVILTGAVTGAGADPQEVMTVRTVLADCPLLVGSGVTPDNLARFVDSADGFIVGTFFEGPCKGRIPGVVEERVSELVAAYRAAATRTQAKG
jgi:membrane complex biogenesis BtpA family protein